MEVELLDSPGHRGGEEEGEGVGEGLAVRGEGEGREGGEVGEEDEGVGGAGLQLSQDGLSGGGGDFGAGKPQQWRKLMNWKKIEKTSSIKLPV